MVGQTIIASEEEKRLEEQSLARRTQLAMSTIKPVWVAAVVLGVSTVALWLLSRDFIQLLLIAGFCAELAVIAGLYPVFRRRGQSIAGIYAVLVSFLLIFTASFVLVPEIELACIAGYLVVNIMGAQLLPEKDSRVMVVVSVLLLAAAVLIVDLVPLPFPSLGRTAGLIIGAVFLAGAFLSTAMIIRQTALGQESFYRQSQRSGWEIERRAAAEQEQREYLQQTVQHYVDSMVEIARGDLSVRVTVAEQGHSADDPLLVLGHSLNETVANLQRMAAQVRVTANNLSSSSAEILAATTQQAAGASEQSAAISQTSTTIDEVRAIADQTAQRAQSVADQAQRTAEISRTGQQAVAETVAEVSSVKQKVETIATGILALSEQAQAVGGIISSVSEIAAQSNMLALNAAVEAARAGEAGKGFAVVAAEVRALAEQSRAATAEVKEILTEIQRGVNTAVMLTEEGMKGADSGAKVAGKTGEAIRRLAESVDESAQAAMQIAAAAGQQVAGMEQIALAMQNIHQVTGQTLSGTRQSEKAAEGLNNLAGQLSQTVEQYRL